MHQKIHKESQCRFCKSSLYHQVVDLGMSPLCQKHVKPVDKNKPEIFYPLKAFVCDSCWLVQLEEFASSEEIFDHEYAYYSSFSKSWLEHTKSYADAMENRFSLNHDHFIVEVASNDGYLLQWFRDKDLKILGIEPTVNTAQVAINKNIPTEVEFFGVATAKSIANRYQKADLLIGNNVLAHVPDINDFVSGLKALLSDSGVITMEFPHLQKLINLNQFDTIYHEHFSYLSISAVSKVFMHHGLELFDVEELSTHGGSVRIYAKHKGNRDIQINSRLHLILKKEESLGMTTLNFYSDFEERVKETKRKLLTFLINIKNAGKTIAGYGAPGKGNTLLNYCGIGTDLIDFTVDRNPHKQGNLLPGSRIPILDPRVIRERKPDYVLILPWNLKTEIADQLKFIEEWGGKFIVPIPEVHVFGTEEINCLKTRA